MNHFTYPQVPSSKQFQNDTSITFAFRKDDIVLCHIDWLLERYQVRNTYETASLKKVILADLFMTCNFWIKSYHDGNSRMKKERYPGVLALFEAVVTALCGELKVRRGAVPDVIGEIYGRDMHHHGIQVDYGQGKAKYLSKMERKIYRLRFKGGVAYQYQWWLRGSFDSRLVLAESKRAYAAIKRRGDDGSFTEGSPDFGCFVVNLEREIYMALPSVGGDGRKDGIFHSSFTAGDVVSMAGTMLIKHGVIRGIRCDSGHYKPVHMNMALLVQALLMYGVNINRITLYDWNGTDLGSAAEFFQSRMSWEQFEKTRREERPRRVAADRERAGRGADPRFPRLQPPALPARPGMAPVGQPLNIPPGEIVESYNA